MRCSVIIVAAGNGTRLGLNVPKAFVPLGGQPLLYYSMRSVGALEIIDEVVVTVPPGTQSRARAEVERAGVQIPVKLVAGGAERQESVAIALGLTSAEGEVVVVHDAARPFAPPAIFAACIEAAGRADGAIAAIAVADTLKRTEGRTITSTIAREGLWRAQTPQAFRRPILVEAHARAVRERSAQHVMRFDIAARISGPADPPFRIADGFRLTGFFLARDLFGQNNAPLPDSRAAFLSAAAKTQEL